ncbi:hypothetical protein BRW64_01760 [Mycolicibacterium diernhoferi]|uniref:DUF6841 domain-containing protein n=2 Tax=Mycolicibacterium diernhoferi TaxID=1801 RepID=A0A1Q4HLC3_9MYCO|nr:hypothetical protein BRW64_01760 [Mycolicibacterium diernhoferi]OPE53149.1 hypothetical protein BV510_17040 [Mycolicibacterium diernhoferi]PEG56110.1 hypothetical protein CRI78_01630 [Mycolicibacterium diernhoferi]
MDTGAVRRWFDDYLDIFAAAARGDRPVAELLDCYAVPLLLTTDEGVLSLATRDELAAVMQGQIDVLRAQRYRSTGLISAEVTGLNASSAVYRGVFVRHDVDGAELGRVAVTYLLVDGSDGAQIAVLASHGD